ncbi:uncharacterized protein LOC114930390 [Nylanderia fulva]|uniref:uncharacterized protein LOC114930390 n=1 Tax=Nylanderia fulva TaxID=613905 RepID=UPI0010FB8D45|nr:uncharacterized protein LOC114930390 [Nylanderia fulva]XP_029157986.1 uncharacterized protein LOC114930390 [Nylanderia fulva]
MLRISLLLSAFEVILCEIHTRSETSSSCKNPPFCYLSNAYKTDTNSMFPHPNYARQQSSLQRSYYNGFNSHTMPAYYSAFDPISILASLAFLAFLLQSFASLYDRSRSILPTIISGRRSTIDDLSDDIPEISGHVSRALQEYENLNEDLERK